MHAVTAIRLVAGVTAFLLVGGFKSNVGVPGELDSLTRDYQIPKCTESNSIKLDSMSADERSSLFWHQNSINDYFCTKDILGNIKFFGVREASLSKEQQSTYMYQVFGKTMKTLWQYAVYQFEKGQTCTMYDVNDLKNRYEKLADMMRKVGAWDHATRLLGHLDAIICNKQSILRRDGRNQLASSNRICLEEVYPVIHMSYFISVLEVANKVYGHDLKKITSRFSDAQSVANRTMPAQQNDLMSTRNRSSLRQLQTCHPVCFDIVSTSRMVTSYMYETCCSMCGSACTVPADAKSLVQSTDVISVSKVSNEIQVVKLSV